MSRVIILVAGKDPEEGIGGHSRYVRTHARAAISLGFEPHIFSAGRRREIAHTGFGTLHRVRSAVGRWLPRPGAMRSREHLMVWRAWAIAADVEAFVRAHLGPHLIHGFGVWGCVGPTVSRRLRRAGVEVIPIVSVYDTWVHEYRAKLRGLSAAHGLLQGLGTRADRLWVTLAMDRVERFAYVGSRRLLIHYECTRRLLEASYGVKATVRKIPYTSETAFLRDATDPTAPAQSSVSVPRSEDTPLIVSVSRHDPRKGLDVLLAALARLRAAGARFRTCLVGGGDLLSAHRELAVRLGLADVTAIEGFVPDPLPYLRSADIFVLPTFGEGGGSLSLLEALQAGVAVVASDVDGISEDVTDGDSALLVSPGSVEDLTMALARLLADSGLRRRLAARAREVFERRFSPEGFAKALRGTYAELGVTP